MTRSEATVAIGLLITLLIAGCAPAASTTIGRPASEGASTGPKRITVAIMEGLFALNSDVGRALTVTSTAGSSEVENLVNAGLVVVDDIGNLHPELAEAVPSLENGLWKLLPDGRMETTYKIKPNARWHDGERFTADDVAFTARVVRDRELGIPTSLAYSSLESVEAPDPSTAVVRWRQPYIDADRLFISGLMPRHLLEGTFVEEKSKFLGLSFWTDQFVGTGAFRLREYAGGSHVLLDANDGYIFGRPTIDSIEVKIIEDRATLIANVLAGSVEMSLGRGISLEQAVLVRNEWKNGTTQITPASWIVIHPQFIEPNPPQIADVRFRRALMHAIDRQQMVDTIQHGLVPVADSIVTPDDPDYAATIGSAVRYEYDPRRAVQLLEELGYRRGSDGASLTLGTQRLAVEYRTMDGYDIHLKTIFPVTEFWQKIGIAVDPIVFPQARAREREWVSTFPSFLMYRQGTGIGGLRSRHSRNTPLPENSYVGQNYARYMNPTFDALIDKYFVTIPKDERIEVAKQLVHHVSDQLPLMGLYYDSEPRFIANRLTGVPVKGSQAWNAHRWKLNT